MHPSRNIRKARVDKVSIYSKTDRNKDHVQAMREQLERLDSDPDRKQRVSECKCKYCFYVMTSRMGGAMITHQECGLCDTVMTFPSTATDPLCTPCAKENDLCKQCGGDVNMKHIRKVRPFLLTNNFS